MRSFIYLECVTEIFPVSPYAYYPDFPVMVLLPDKSVQSVPASVLRTVLQGFTAQSPVFPQNPEREIGLLPVSRLRSVNPFEKLFYSGYQSDESEISEIYGSVYGRRYENMRQTAYFHGVQRTEGFSYHEFRSEFLHGMRLSPPPPIPCIYNMMPFFSIKIMSRQIYENVFANIVQLD